MDESLTLEETNKIRVALGLKPLQDPGNTPAEGPSEDDLAYENYRKAEEASRALRQQQQRREQELKELEKAERTRKLTGKGLGEASDEESDSIKSWIKSRKNRTAQHIEVKPFNSENEQKTDSYSSTDLVGLRVGHSFHDVKGTEILTLKDTTVLEERDDELVSENLVILEKTKERIENRKKSRLYASLDDDQYDGGILNQYKEDKEQQFILGEDYETSLATERAELAKHGTLISLETNGTSQTSEVKNTNMKASKPRKRPKLMKKEFDTEIVQSWLTKKPLLDNIQLSRDDSYNLETVLARHRESVLRKQQSMDADNLYDDEPENAPEDGIVIDECTGFLDGLRASDPQPDIRNSMFGVEPQNINADNQPVDDVKSTEEPEHFATEEPTLNKGVGAAFTMLQERGIVQKQTKEVLQKLEQQRKDVQWVTEKKALDFKRSIEEQRRKEEMRANQAGLSAKERERLAQIENRRREKLEAKASMERFENYKPEVKLVYKDEFGRDMDAKEAFKYMSHQFHGKGSGANKTEKRLKRIKEEQKREQQALSIGRR